MNLPLDHIQLPLPHVHPVVVVGKIIIDEYQSPNDDNAIISIGGGGPQAAWGAAAALAVLTASAVAPFPNGEDDALPHLQPVAFFGPVGDLDWTETEDVALRTLLSSAVAHVCPVRGRRLQTPRIRLWHDENQNIQWHPLNDSFGHEGSQQLWNNRPSADDILTVLETTSLNGSAGVICHAIMEAGTSSPGEGNDAAAFLDTKLQQRIRFLGIEPVAFPEEATGFISTSNAQTCIERLQRYGSVLNAVSPDDVLFRALESSLPLLQPYRYELAVRNGPKGSRIIFLPASGDDHNNDVVLIPAASLETLDGKPVNPTGAGNAYAAAYTTCRGNGLPACQAASIASAIGAIMCEHHHIPPWNNQVLARIQRAIKEIEANIPLQGTNSSSRLDRTYK